MQEAECITAVMDERVKAVALLSTSVSSTVSSMRRNAKFTGGSEASLIEAFRWLRRRLRTWSVWAEVQPLDYLAPFLAVVRSDETSGPITATALTSLLSILSAGLVRPDAPAASEAMHALVDAVTHCRFEATDPGHDEAVLALICDVLLAALHSPAGALLSDEAVCAVVQAAYHIGHQSGRERPLLTGVSRRALRQVVQHVFGLANARALAGPAAPPSPQPRASVAGSLSGLAGSHAAAGEAATRAAAQPGAAALPGHGLPVCLELFSFAVSLAAYEEEEEARAGGAAGAPGAAPGSSRDELRLTGVSLAAAALEAGAAAFASQPQLMALCRDDLCRALVGATASSSAPPPLLAAACGLMVQLSLRMRPLLRHQLAAFLQFSLLPLAEAPGGEAQRCALEALSALATQLPEWCCELFANYDCDVRAPPLFERTLALLAKAAFPTAPAVGGSTQLSACNLMAVEALSGVLDAMAERTSLPGARLGLAAAAEGEEAERFDPAVWAQPGGYLARAAAAAAAGDAAAAAAQLLRARALRGRVADAAEHFNREAGKGFQLLAACGLLPPAALRPGGLESEPAAALALAAFLRYASGLDKAAVGEYLGEPGAAVAAVLAAYAQLFDFSNLPFDAALRLFLDGFLLPGEAQKIARCLEAFAHRFHACNLGGVAADADSAYVLSYAVVMLNTDLHNTQVRGKMTRDQFIRNTRGTNGGADWPKEYLEAMYDAIAADEIRLSAAGAAGGCSAAGWLAASRAAASGEAGLLRLPPAVAAALDAELFGRVWGAAVGALACVFEHAAATGSAGREARADAAAGLATCARVAAAHGLPQVVDHCVATLCRFTQQHPGAGGGSEAAAAAFGGDARALLAAQAAVAVAQRHGDSLRSGWRPLLDMLLRLHSMGLLRLPRPDGEEESPEAPPLPPPPQPAARAQPATGGLLRGFSSLLSLEAEPAAAAPLQEAELEQLTAARAAGEQLRVQEVVADSLFLQAPALGALAEALAAAGASAAGAGDLACASAAQDLLAALALVNRDRIVAVWPHLVATLRSCVLTGCAAGGEGLPLAERALVTLLRLCQRLLPYKHELAEELLGALRLVLGLDARAADALMPRIADELRQLLARAGSHVRAAEGWDTLGRLLAASSRHPEASGAAFEALTCVMCSPAFGQPEPGEEAPGEAPGALRPPTSFLPCCAAAAAFASGRAGGEARSRAACALLGAAGAQLAALPPAAPPGPSDAQLQPLHASWAELLSVLRRLGGCGEERAEVRDEAQAALLRALLAAQPLRPPAQLLARVYDTMLLPLFGELVDAARRRGRDAAAAERALLAALPLLCKPLLTYLPQLLAGLPPPEWHALWAAVLDRLCATARVAASEELQEAVPEALKNCILVFATSGAQAEQTDGFWELTWRRAGAVDAGLTAEALLPGRAGVSGGAAAAAAAAAEAEA